MSANMEALRSRVFESGDRKAVSESGDAGDPIGASGDAANAVEVRRYVNVIEASLREGEGTYTGTIAQAKP